MGIDAPKYTKNIASIIEDKFRSAIIAYAVAPDRILPRRHPL